MAVFTNYRGEMPMQELAMVPYMAGLMWNFWNESRPWAKSPEEHANNIANHGCFNEWFGADMEPKGEGDEAVVESIFEVLADACNIRPNPDPNHNPQPVITRSPMEGKGANGTAIKGYPRPGSKGVSRNAVAFTFQMETVGPAYKMAMDRALKVMAGQTAKEWKSEDITLVWHDIDSNHHAAQCMSTVSGTQQGDHRRDQRCGGGSWIRGANQHRHTDDEASEQGGQPLRILLQHGGPRASGGKGQAAEAGGAATDPEADPERRGGSGAGSTDEDSEGGKWGGHDHPVHHGHPEGNAGVLVAGEPKRMAVR